MQRTRQHRWWALLLTIAMMITMVPAFALGADEPSVSEDLLIIQEYFKGKTKLSAGSPKIYFQLPDGEGGGEAYSNAYDTVTYGAEEGQYTNVYDYLRDKAAKLTGRAPGEITVTAGASMPGTVGNTTPATPLKAAIMDGFGNLTPQYYETCPNTLYVGAAPGNANEVKFTIEGQTVGVGQIYLYMQPLAADPEKKLELEASAIYWDRISGKAVNTGLDNVLDKLGVLSGSNTGNLPSTAVLYTNTDSGVGLSWSLTYTGEGNDPKSLSLAGSTVTFGKRPNIVEDDAKYRLRATLVSKEDNTKTKDIDFNVTVPAFTPRTVPVRISPANAEISVKDSYYNSEVDGKYISVTEGGALRTYTLHGNVTNAAQSYSFIASAPGYITSTKTVSVTGDMPEQAINLVLSSEDDTLLKSLDVTSPSGASSIITDMGAFDPSVENYSLTVGPVDYVTVIPSVITEGATFKVNRHANATAASSGTLTDSISTNTNCYLKKDGSPTVIKVTVTAPQSSTQETKTKVYTITVTRGDTEYPLNALAITTSSSMGGSVQTTTIPKEETLAPTVSKAGFANEYIYYVNYTRDQIDIKPTANADMNVTGIKVGDEIVASGAKSSVISLDVGTNEIPITVTYGDGETEVSPLSRHNIFILNEPNISM